MFYINNVLTKQHGVDYGIIECLFGLLLQSVANETVLNFMFVSRMLLQCVKSTPLTMPLIVVSAMSTMLEDLLPSMTLSCHAFMVRLLFSEY